MKTMIISNKWKKIGSFEVVFLVPNAFIDQWWINF